MTNWEYSLAEAEKEIKIINRIPEGVREYFSFISGNDVYFEFTDPDIQKKVRAQMIKTFGPDKLSRYYANASDTLAVRYIHVDINVIYYVPMTELENYGPGCHVKYETVSNETARIVCKV